MCVDLKLYLNNKLKLFDKYKDKGMDVFYWIPLQKKVIKQQQIYIKHEQLQTITISVQQ